MAEEKEVQIITFQLNKPLTEQTMDEIDKILEKEGATDIEYDYLSDELEEN